MRQAHEGADSGRWVGRLGRLARLIVGGDVEPALRPLAVVSFAASLAGSGFWSFMAIWAIDELGASSRQLAVGFLVGALAAGVTGYAAGHLSDHLGRRRLMLTGEVALCALAPLFLLVGDDVLLGLGLMALTGSMATIGGSVGGALVADLVPPERHESGYATVRVASNLGVVFGPPIGSLFLFVGGWSLLFPGVAVLAAMAWTLGVPVHTGARTIHAGSATRPRLARGAHPRPHVSALHRLEPVRLAGVRRVRDGAAGVSRGHTWLRQGGVGAAGGRQPPDGDPVPAADHARGRSVPCGTEARGRDAAHGPPVLLFRLSAAVPVVVAVIVVFVLGEMLWVPTSQAIVAGLAPEDLRGAYMGAFGSMAAAGFALAPFTGLQVRAAYGDDAMWAMFAGISVVSALLGAIACRGVARARRTGSAVLDT